MALKGLTRGRDLRGDVTLDVDAVVVGTGGGGSLALRRARARAGLDAVALEMGAYSTSADFDQREDHMIPRIFQEAGGRATADMAIRVLQGRGVGGSTVLANTNLCKPIPDAILDLWTRRYVHSAWGPRTCTTPSPPSSATSRHVRDRIGVARNANNDPLRAVGASRLAGAAPRCATTAWAAWAAASASSDARTTPSRTL